MRIIGGKLKGRELVPPRDKRIRPSKARTREAVLNIIESRYRDRLIDGNVADLFAGTGAMGIEALSRGARHALFVDSAAEAVAAIRQNLTILGLSDQADVIRGNAGRIQISGPFDIVFMDPPYGGEDTDRAINNISNKSCTHADSILILELSKRDPIPAMESFALVHEKLYGNSKIVVLSAKQ